LALALRAQVPDSASTKLAMLGPDMTAAAVVAQPRHFLRFDVLGMYDSNVLRNELVMGLWRGEDLGRDLRQRSQRTTQTANRAGYLVDARMSYAWGEALFGDASMRPRLSVSASDVMGLRYADDLYNVTFFGNGGYENRVAELGPGSLEQVRYQTFGFGMEDKSSRSYLMLQLVNGQRLTSANIRQADLFTGTDGRYLRLDVDGDLARSDTAGNAFTNGLGMAISAEVVHAFSIAKRPAQFTVGVYDLGAIAWNGNALRVPKDSTLIYDGIGVADVIDLDGVVVGQDGLQDTLGLGYARGAFLRPLPARALARLRVAAADRIGITAQVEVRALPGFLPRTTLAGDHRFGRNERLRLEVSQGGFGGWRTGAAWEHRFCKALRATLAAENGMGLVSANARGRSLSLGVELEW
jgi:hypothetical protein